MRLRIKEVRESLDLSQKDFAMTLGIKPTTFNGYETGMHDPKSDVLLLISKTYNVSIDYMLGISETMFLADSPIISTTEQPPIKKYHLLNEDGKAKADGYIEDLLDNPKYQAGVSVEEETPFYISSFMKDVANQPTPILPGVLKGVADKKSKNCG